MRFERVNQPQNPSNAMPPMGIFSSQKFFPVMEPSAMFITAVFLSHMKKNVPGMRVPWESFHAPVRRIEKGQVFI